MVTEDELKNMSPEEIAELQKQNCIFCKIISGEVPGKKVFEDYKLSAILDIRPIVEGHILVMPKEHHPILPLIPREDAKHMFETTRELCIAAKESIPSPGTTVFIANGAAAGQQSPHFLFHIIPRSENDGLSIFDLPEKDIGQADIKENLKKRFGTLVKGYLAQEGKLPPEEVQEAAKEQLALILEKNPDVKKLLKDNPEEFKKLLLKNEQLKEFFKGVDIDMLSEKLRQAESSDQDNEEAQEERENKAERDKADLDKVSGLFK